MKIFIFNSIHYVLKAETLLKENSIDCDLIPVPKEIDSNCGMAIMLDNKVFNKAKDILLSEKMDMKIYSYNEKLNFYLEEKI